MSEITKAIDSVTEVLEQINFKFAKIEIHTDTDTDSYYIEKDKCKKNWF